MIPDSGMAPGVLAEMASRFASREFDSELSLLVASFIRYWSSFEGGLEMHAVFIEVEVSGDGADDDRKLLRDQIPSAIQQLAGFRSGIWLNRHESNQAMSITIWDTAEQANAMVAMFGPESGDQAGGSVLRCEVSKVAASAFCYFQPGTQP